MSDNFSSEEFSRLAMLMQEHHSIFYEMWHLGKPIFSDRVPTACVLFDKTGEAMHYEINPEFWKTLSDTRKCFVIAHESTHVFLNHGIRANAKIDMVANKTMDVVVNHTLVDNFGFIREEVDPENIYCWRDTVFANCDEEIKDNQSFEYYYSMIKKHGSDEGEAGEGNQLVDSHEGFGDASKFLKKLGEQLTDKAKEELKEFIQKHMPKGNPDNGKKAGSESNGMEYLVPNRKPKKKKKWETIIKKWAAKYLTIQSKDKHQWAKTNRRFAILKNDLLLPSEMEVDDIDFDHKKINVWFFQDTSGSCEGFKDRFFTAAETLPTERFEVKMHCFDTKVYETTLKSRKLYGFGGTTFSCIEEYIQGYMKKHNCKYPDACFIVTDGAGNAVKPQKPQNWYWFLSEQYLQYIPEKSKWYNLKDFE